MIRYCFLSLVLILTLTACQGKNGSISPDNPPAPVLVNQEPAAKTLPENPETADSIASNPLEKERPEKPSYAPEMVEKTTPAKKSITHSQPQAPAVQTETDMEKNISQPTPAGPPAMEIDHTAWDKLLQQYANPDGLVNYKGLKNDLPLLDAYLNHLAENPPQNTWSREKQMAYWINAYNAFTIKLILDHYPVKSIMDIHGGKPWDVKWIKLGGQSYSLNQIENDILRPKFKDPRIHFAVNCAARSCPPLLNRAWTADNLNHFFDQQAKTFINHPGFNQVKPDQVRISKIFEWYAADFGNLIDYLNKYSNVKVKPGSKVGYLEYDWGLNER